MPRTAKPRKDSAEGKALQLAEGRKPLEPVQPLKPEAKYYFDLYTSCRPSFDWSRGDLIRLTQISRSMAEIDALTAQLEAEGYTIPNPRGTQIMNPIMTARDQLTRTVMAAERSLSIYAPVEGGAKKNMFEQNKEIDRQQSQADDLLA